MANNMFEQQGSSLDLSLLKSVFGKDIEYSNSFREDNDRGDCNFDLRFSKAKLRFSAS